MSIDESGYLSSGWKIALFATAIIAVVALTIVTCGAGSIVGTMVISGAINIVAQTATVAIAQTEYSKAQGDPKEDVTKDTIDAVADCIGEIVLKTVGVKSATGIGTWAATILGPSIQASSQVSAASGVSFSQAFLHGGVVQYANSSASIAGKVIAYGFSAYYLGSALWSIVDDEYAYDMASRYGWKPR